MSIDNYLIFFNPSADGIAASTFGSIMNYLILGLAVSVDRYYLHSFEILLACTVVFPGVGNLGYTLLEYRLGHRNFFGAMIENLRWVPFLYVPQNLPIVRTNMCLFLQHVLLRRPQYSFVNGTSSPFVLLQHVSSVFRP